jgi:acyl carrier protein
MENTQKNKLKEIICMVLELRDGENPEDARKLSNERWDSLAQVNMIAAIESEFSIAIAPKDYARFTSYKSIEILLDEILK